jgi:hypothetical protein
MPTDSETKLAEWALSAGLPLEAYFEGTDEERRALVEKLARDHYRKGTTEAYIKTVGSLWKDIQPILQTEAEEQSVEPKLQRLERAIGEVNTRSEIRIAQQDYEAIARNRLSEPRITRYDRIGTNLDTIQKVMDALEAETAMLHRTPLITSEERREQNVNALLREARRQGITTAGGQPVGESKVRYRSNAAPRTFQLREYPIRNYDERTGTWREGPLFRVYSEEGKLLGAFDHRPSWREIQQRWRSE